MTKKSIVFMILIFFVSFHYSISAKVNKRLDGKKEYIKAKSYKLDRSQYYNLNNGEKIFYIDKTTDIHYHGTKKRLVTQDKRVPSNYRVTTTRPICETGANKPVNSISTP